MQHADHGSRARTNPDEITASDHGLSHRPFWIFHSHPPQRSGIHISVLNNEFLILQHCSDHWAWASVLKADTFESGNILLTEGLAPDLERGRMKT
jgi:hypothetical protein